MPTTLLVPTLAVVALIPLVTPRPPPYHNDHDLLTSYDRTTTIDNLVSCIEEDTTLVDRLRSCLQYDTYLEDDLKDGNNLDFRLLDEDWTRFKISQEGTSENLLLKSKLVRGFRKLLASLYQIHFARNDGGYGMGIEINSTVASSIDKPKGTEEIVVGNIRNIVTEAVEETSYPMLTTDPQVEDQLSNETVYEGAGSDSEYTYVNPAPEVNRNSTILDTDHIYVPGITSESTSFNGEYNDINKDIGHLAPTTSGLDSLSQEVKEGIDLSDGHSYISGTFSTMSTTTSDIGRNNLGNDNTDIDVNELFPIIRTSTSTESAEESESANGKTDIGFGTLPNENESKRISTTESLNHSSQYIKSIPNHSTAQSSDEQTTEDQTTDQSINEINREQPVNRESPTSLVTSTPITNNEGKGDYQYTEESPEPVSHSAGKILPTDLPTSYSAPNYNTPAGVEDSAKEDLEPTSYTPNIHFTSRNQDFSVTFSDYENPIDKPFTSLPESLSTYKLEDEPGGYKDSNYFPTQSFEDPTHLYGTKTSVVSTHVPGTTPLNSVEEPYGIKYDNTDHSYPTEILSSDSTYNLKSEDGKSFSTISFEPMQFTVGEASTQGGNEIKYDQDSNHDIKGIEITPDSGITSHEPEIIENKDQGQTADSEINDTSYSLLPVSEEESDRHSHLAEGTLNKDTTTEAINAVPQTPQSKNEDYSFIDNGSDYDQEPTTDGYVFYDNKTNTKIIYGIESTTENNIFINQNNTTVKLEKGGKKESLNKIRIFTIPLPAVQKAKQANVIVNTLRIFPSGNEHTTIFQPSHKRGCLSNNDCVRVRAAVNRDSKQRRAHSNVEGGEAQDQHLEGNLDNILWWHKVRALKKS